MNDFIRNCSAFPASIPLVVATLLLAGCASPHTDPSKPRPGAGLEEYGRLVLDLRKTAAVARLSVLNLTTANAANTNLVRREFDNAVHRLEVVSIRTRARVEALEARGSAYFAEWEEEIAGSKDAVAHEAEAARLTALRPHFEAILSDSRKARQDFKRFLDGLRSLQASLGNTTAAPLGENRPDRQPIIADGLLADGALEKLGCTIQAALAVVHSGAVGSPVTGGQR